MTTSQAATTKKEKQPTTYNSIINDLSFVQCHTKKCEKREVLKKIAHFLYQEGYQQLGEALEARTRELTHE